MANDSSRHCNSKLAGHLLGLLPISKSVMVYVSCSS